MISIVIPILFTMVLIFKFGLNLMSKVSLEEAILLLRSNCFDRGGVAVGEIRPLSDTWGKVFISTNPSVMLKFFLPPEYSKRSNLTCQPKQAKDTNTVLYLSIC